METIQVVLDSELLQAANEAAKRAGVNRSALIREALRQHLRQLRRREVEAREERGYQEHFPAASEVADWEEAASWPEP